MRGLIHPNVIHELAVQLQKKVEQSEIPWVYISVLGFRHAPVSWKMNEHGYGTTGENDTVILLTKKRTTSIHIVGDQDEFQ